MPLIILFVAVLSLPIRAFAQPAAPAARTLRGGVEPGVPAARTLRGGVESGAPAARTLRGGVEPGAPAARTLRGGVEQQPPQLPVVEFSVEVLGNAMGDFTAKMDAYAALRRSLQEGLPALTVTDRPDQIRQAEQLLAQRIREARAGAGRGDIFTEDIRRGFKQLLRPVTNAGTCAFIRDDNPGEFAYAVNSDYPKNKAFSSVPAAMLAVLPRLPEDVWYRFLDRDLILHDSRANVILDRIDDAVRCDK